MNLDLLENERYAMHLKQNEEISADAWLIPADRIDVCDQKAPQKPKAQTPEPGHSMEPSDASSESPVCAIGTSTVQFMPHVTHEGVEYLTGQVDKRFSVLVKYFDESHCPPQALEAHTLASDDVWGMDLARLKRRKGRLGGWALHASCNGLPRQERSRATWPSVGMPTRFLGQSTSEAKKKLREMATQVQACRGEPTLNAESRCPTNAADACASPGTPSSRLAASTSTSRFAPSSATESHKPKIAPPLPLGVLSSRLDGHVVGMRGATAYGAASAAPLSDPPDSPRLHALHATGRPEEYANGQSRGHWRSLMARPTGESGFPQSLAHLKQQQRLLPQTQLHDAPHSPRVGDDQYGRELDGRPAAVSMDRPHNAASRVEDARDSAREQWTRLCDFVVAERKRAADLNHFNVMKLMGICLDTPRPCIMYKLPNGACLKDFMANDPRGAQQRALSIACDIARGLTFLHTHHNIVHHNIAPASIFVHAQGRAVIGNFTHTVCYSPSPFTPKTVPYPSFSHVYTWWQKRNGHPSDSGDIHEVGDSEGAVQPSGPRQTHEASTGDLRQPMRSGDSRVSTATSWLYVAPEIYKRRLSGIFRHDASVDVYGLGMLLLSMCIATHSAEDAVLLAYRQSPQCRDRIDDQNPELAWRNPFLVSDLLSSMSESGWRPSMDFLLSALERHGSSVVQATMHEEVAGVVVKAWGAEVKTRPTSGILFQELRMLVENEAKIARCEERRLSLTSRHHSTLRGGEDGGLR